MPTKTIDGCGCCSSSSCECDTVYGGLPDSLTLTYITNPDDPFGYAGCSCFEGVSISLSRGEAGCYYGTYGCDDPIIGCTLVMNFTLCCHTGGSSNSVYPEGVCQGLYAPFSRYWCLFIEGTTPLDTCDRCVPFSTGGAALISFNCDPFDLVMATNVFEACPCYPYFHITL